MTTTLDAVSYRDWQIIPKLDFGRLHQGERVGFLILRQGSNVAPGATWFETVSQAKKGVDACILATKDGVIDGVLFWLLMGKAGLDITDSFILREELARKPDCVIRAEDSPLAIRVRTEGSDIRIASLGNFNLNAKEALALSVQLKYAAERALGRTI